MLCDIYPQYWTSSIGGIYLGAHPLSPCAVNNNAKKSDPILIPVNIPAKRVPVFKPGSTLKSAVANSK